MNKTVTSIYLAQQVRELDRITIEEKGIPGIQLMRIAAQACVDVLLGHASAPGKVSVLCGSGNNAGDGFIIAGLLANRGIEVTVGLVGKVPSAETDAGKAYGYCREAGVEILTAELSLQDSAFVVDALLGTGLMGPVRPEYQQVISAVNLHDCKVLAVDLPSGLCADTGNILGACIKADMTVTFIGRKLGLLTNDGPEVVGELNFADLSVPASVFDSIEPSVRMLSYEDRIRKLPLRNRNAHKMNHGHVLVVGGDQGMAGAVAMAAEAALYSGAGLVSVATHPTSVNSLVARRPEVMAQSVTTPDELKALINRATVVVVGPGLGNESLGNESLGNESLVNESLGNESFGHKSPDGARAWGSELLDIVLESELPMIIDADGLNRLSRLSPEYTRRDNWILTPHPGEARSLLGKNVQVDRLASVKQLQQKYGGVCLLKGAGTLIAGHHEVWLCPYGNPGMSVAGMGDVLSGIIGGLVAQGLDTNDAACLGAIVHSLAADNITARQGERGLLATQLLPEIRKLLNGMPG
ncbi:MAG: NAD(P)H-hydrate dehydratase [Gammaproteobacteria bacterium]|nr:NAD(P)H-hydrate dehydratase [Gammaproteobacteria bacterium]